MNKLQASLAIGVATLLTGVWSLSWLSLVFAVGNAVWIYCFLTVRGH